MSKIKIPKEKRLKNYCKLCSKEYETTVLQHIVKTHKLECAGLGLIIIGVGWILIQYVGVIL